MNAKDFFSVDSEGVVTGGVLGGLPKVKPTGFPMLPPEVPGLVVAEDAPKVNFVPVDGNPPNRDVAGLSLSKPVLPKWLVVDEDVGTTNPPNGLATFSVPVVPNPPNTFVVVGFSSGLDDPEKDGVVFLSFSLSSLSPNTEGVDEPPNRLVVVGKEDPPKKDPEDVELEVEFPNKVGLELSLGGSSAVLFARDEAKKSGVVEEVLLAGLVVLPKPNVGAGGPPEDSEVGAGIEGNANPVDDFELSMDVREKKLLDFEPKEDVFALSEGFGPGKDKLGGAGVDNLGASEVKDTGVFDKLGALKRIDGPGSGPRGRVFLGELLNEPASCLSHTDWMARRLAAY